MRSRSACWLPALGETEQARAHSEAARRRAAAIRCRPAEAEAHIELARTLLETEPDDEDVALLRLERAVQLVERGQLAALARRAAEVAMYYETRGIATGSSTLDQGGSRLAERAHRVADTAVRDHL